jgi:hypothetical protein
MLTGVVPTLAAPEIGTDTDVLTAAGSAAVAGLVTHDGCVIGASSVGPAVTFDTGTGAVPSAGLPDGVNDDAALASTGVNTKAATASIAAMPATSRRAPASATTEHSGSRNPARPSLRPPTRDRDWVKKGTMPPGTSPPLPRGNDQSGGRPPRCRHLTGI